MGSGRYINANEEAYYTYVHQFRFDQPLYVQEAILCARAEMSCEVDTCTPCDWTAPENVNIFSLFSHTRLFHLLLCVFLRPLHSESFHSIIHFS